MTPFYGGAHLQHCNTCSAWSLAPTLTLANNNLAFKLIYNTHTHIINTINIAHRHWLIELVSEAKHIKNNFLGDVFKAINIIHFSSIHSHQRPLFI